MSSSRQRRIATRFGEAAVAFLTLALLAELLLPAYTNGERTLDGLLLTTVLPWSRNLCLLASLVCGLAWLLIARRDW